MYFYNLKTKPTSKELDMDTFKVVHVDTKKPVLNLVTNMLNPIDWEFDGKEADNASAVFSQAQSKLETHIKTTESTLALLKKRLENLFGVEVEAKKNIQDKIAAIESKTDKLTKVFSDATTIKEKEDFLQNVYINLWKAGYGTYTSIEPVQPENPLTWRRPNGLPVFALFSLNNSSYFFISVRDKRFHRVSEIGVDFQQWKGLLQDQVLEVLKNSTYTIHFPLKIPGNFTVNYGDVVLKMLHTLETLVKDRQTLASQEAITELVVATGEISAKFDGLIPAKTRSNIRKAQKSKLFEEIYILAEVEEWAEHMQLNIIKTVPPLSPALYKDPIVYGWTPSYQHRLWYIDSFDITDLENLVPLTLSEQNSANRKIIEDIERESEGL